MLQQVAELVGLDDAQVDRHARVGARPRGVLARRRGALDDVELGEGGQQRRRVGGGGDDVEVLDRVGQAPRRAGQLDAVARPGARAAPRRSPSPISQRLVEQHRAASAPRRRRRRTPRARPPRTSRPKPRTSRSCWASAAARSALERVDAELVVELARALGPEAGQAREVDEARRELRRAASRRPGSCPVSSSALDLLLERLADARQLGDLALARQRRDRARRLAHRLGGVAVGERRGARPRRRARRGRPARRRATAMVALGGSGMGVGP